MGATWNKDGRNITERASDRPTGKEIVLEHGGVVGESRSLPGEGRTRENRRKGGRKEEAQRPREREREVGEVQQKVEVRVLAALAHSLGGAAVAIMNRALSVSPSFLPSVLLFVCRWVGGWMGR